MRADPASQDDFFWVHESALIEELAFFFQKGLQPWIEQKGSDKTAIHPFQVNFPETKLADLRQRLAQTRLPDKETVTDLFAGRTAQDRPAGSELLAECL